MTRIISKYKSACLALALGCSLALTTSCTDYLDKSPESDVSPEAAFKNFKNFQGFTEELYLCIPDFSKSYWTTCWNWGEDDIQAVGFDYLMGYKVDQGDFWGWQKEFDGWGACFMDQADTFDPNDRFKRGLWKAAWYGIRKANLGLENMNLMTAATQEALQSSRNEIAKGKYAISENQAKLYPQINAVAQLNDNFTPPVSVTDGSAYGKPYNVTKTLQYNASAGVQLQMPLYNQMILTAIDITKIADKLNQLSYEKAREDLIVQTAKMYYMAQNTSEQIRLTDDNIKRLVELRNITQAFYDNQMSLEVDLKRVNLNIENLTVQRDNAIAMLEQQYTMLKYVIDYPAEKEMKVTAVDPGKIEMVKADGLDTGLYELQLLEQKKLLTQKQTKLAKDGYLPSLSLTGNLMYSAFTDRIDHWIHSGESNHWYGSNGLGIQLRVPVFDGFEKRSKIRKAKIEEENARIGYEDALKGLQANYMNAVSEVNNSQRNYKKQFDNYTMAQDVYNVTADQYKEGVASMTAVLQDEMRMSEAMNNYLTAYYRYKVANLSLLKLTGQLNQISVAK